jgi:hypothetical protein
MHQTTENYGVKRSHTTFHGTSASTVVLITNTGFKD